MDTILLNITNPSWWFTGLFFIFVAFAIKPVGKFILTFVKRLFKGWRLKRLKKIRSLRISLASITYEVVRSHAYFVIFLLLCLLYMFWYTASPLTELVKTSPIAAMILSLPIYIAEIIWIYRDAFSKDLVKEHNKLLKYIPAKKTGLHGTQQSCAP
jgi:CDP-diglyceride synthetase